MIGLPSNLFYSTGIPVCILVLKKCKNHDDVLFVNASEFYKSGRRQNELRKSDISKIVEIFKFRTEEERYSRRVESSEIEENGFNLNITRYVSTAKPEPRVDLQEVHQKLMDLDAKIQKARDQHNSFLRELGLNEI